MSTAGVRPLVQVDRGRFAYLLRGFSGQEHSEATFKGVFRELDRSSDCIDDATFSGDFETAPLFELYHREKGRLYDKQPFSDAWARGRVARTRDITDVFHAHLAYRRKHGGNTVLEFSGPTGLTKSSCALGLMERYNGLLDVVREGGSAGLARHLAIDIGDALGKLGRLQRFQGVLIDEQTHLVGEGAEVALRLLRNVEDQIRASQRDLYYCSPGRRDNHDASQGVLDVSAWSPPELTVGRAGKLESRCMYWLGLNGEDPIPLGYVDLKWCSEETFRAYQPLKAANVDRALSGHFTANGATDDEIIRRLFEEPAVSGRLRLNPSPKKLDWKRWLTRYCRSMGTADLDRTASELTEMWSCIRDEPTLFRAIWGWDPTPAMLKVAKPSKPVSDEPQEET